MTRPSIVARLPEYGLLAALVLLVGALAVTEPRFRTSDNILTILDQASVVMIVAIPFAMLLIARHIDLSVGSAIAVTGVVGARVMTSGGGTMAGIAVVLALALLIGTINGALCTYLRFSPIVVTLGMLGALRGLAFVFQDQGSASADLGHAFKYLGQGRLELLDIPIKVLVAAAVVAIGWLVLYRTRKGRHIQAIGANPAASFLVGIKVERTALGIYIATSLAVGLAALVTISDLNSGPPDVANGFEITVLTAVLLGGVAFNGGRGSILGVMLGVLFIHVLSNGFTLWGLSTNQVRVANGVVLVAAAGLQALATWLGGRSRAPARDRKAPPGNDALRRPGARELATTPKGAV
jgi:ribose/xylose/arabinose/galactoside ABC-type transport system permease subunit